MWTISVHLPVAHGSLEMKGVKVTLREYQQKTSKETCDKIHAFFIAVQVHHINVPHNNITSKKKIKLIASISENTAPGSHRVGRFAASCRVVGCVKFIGLEARGHARVRVRVGMHARRTDQLVHQHIRAGRDLRVHERRQVLEAAQWLDALPLCQVVKSKPVALVIGPCRIMTCQEDG